MRRLNNLDPTETTLQSLTNGKAGASGLPQSKDEARRMAANFAKPGVAAPKWLKLPPNCRGVTAQHVSTDERPPGETYDQEA